MAGPNSNGAIIVHTNDLYTYQSTTVCTTTRLPATCAAGVTTTNKSAGVRCLVPRGLLADGKPAGRLGLLRCQLRRCEPGSDRPTLRVCALRPAASRLRTGVGPRTRPATRWALALRSSGTPSSASTTSGSMTTRVAVPGSVLLQPASTRPVGTLRSSTTAPRPCSDTSPSSVA